MANILDLLIELSKILILLLALTSIYSLILPRLKQIRSSSMSIVIGLIFGLIGIIGMYESGQVAEGIHFNGRVIIAALSGAIGGFIPGIVTGTVMGSVRMWSGGAGAISSTGAALAGAITGALFFRYQKKDYEIYSIKQLTLLGVLLVIEVILAVLTLPIPLDARLNIIGIVILPILILYPAGTVAFGLLLTDTTKRRGKTQELHDLFEYANDSIYIFDVDDDRFLHVNENAARLLGYSKEELLEMTVSDISTTSMEKINDIRQRLINGQSLFLEAVHKKKDGTMIPVEVNTRTGKFKGRKVGQAFVRDITNRKQIETALKESEERFKIFYNAAFEGIVISQNGKLIDFNDRITQVLRYDRVELIGEDILKIVAEEDREFVADKIQSRFEEPFELQVLTRDGSMRFIEVSSRDIKYSSKPGRVTAIRDITARKQREEEEEHQQQQLMQADKMISLGILTSGVAHEINNPNQFIMSHIEPLSLAYEGARPILDRYMEEHGDFRLGGVNYSLLRDRIPRYLKNISEGADRIKTIVNELRQFSREYQDENLEAIQINNVVQSALTLTTNLIKNSTNRFSVSLSKDIPPLMGHYQRLEQVLINLIQNACQALPGPDNAINVSTGFDTQKSVIFVKVIDAGSGISPEDLKHITDPFYTTKRDKEGVGLGLSISANIINQHKGQMLFSSEPGKGTEVTLSFPVNGLHPSKK